MSETVFTRVDYTLSTLTDAIELGTIGLPDIQRPFVWKNAKVRNLFDSMYRGFPVGVVPTAVEFRWGGGLRGHGFYATFAFLVT